MREGWAIFRLAIKLKKLKQTIKEWAKCRGGDKALGPDGYPIAFFQCFWDTTKADMAFLSEFHLRGRLSRNLDHPSLLSS